MKRTGIAMALAASLVVSGCEASDSALPTFDNPVKGDRVDPESFLEALRASFRTGSTAAVTFDVRGAGLRGGGSVRYRADGVDANLRVDDWKVAGASIEIQAVDGTTYMRVPESRGLWVKLDGAGTATPGADLAKEADPRQALGELRDNLDEIRFSGTETVNGVHTRRFQVVTDAADGTSTPSVTQYWFDGRDRVVRRQSDLTQAASATFTWTEWGESVRIQRPKPNTVVTMNELERLRKRQQEPSQ